VTFVNISVKGRCTYNTPHSKRHNFKRSYV